MDLGSDSGHQRLGGSALLSAANGDRPNVEDPAHLKALLDLVLSWKRQGKILAMHDQSTGVLATLLEMSFAGRLGIDIEVPESDDFNRTVMKKSALRWCRCVWRLKPTPGSCSVIGRIQAMIAWLPTGWC